MLSSYKRGKFRIVPYTLEDKYKDSHNLSSIMDVGCSLRQLKKERRKSIRSLATISGLPSNALSTIEHVLSSPSVSIIYMLSETHGVPITALLWTE